MLAALLSQHDLAGDQAGPAQESFESTPADLFERNPVVEERAKALWSNVEQKDERKGPLAAGDRGGARARAPARSAPAAAGVLWVSGERVLEGFYALRGSEARAAKPALLLFHAHQSELPERAPRGGLTPFD